MYKQKMSKTKLRFHELFHEKFFAFMQKNFLSSCRNNIIELFPCWSLPFFSCLIQNQIQIRYTRWVKFSLQRTWDLRAKTKQWEGRNVKILLLSYLLLTWFYSFQKVKCLALYPVSLLGVFSLIPTFVLELCQLVSVI